ncbi:MAG: DUF4372 domain-containing protein [Bryobacterales bacterium]|nr:DUF4372 domain-containing protein [Bryobacterales bacterium]
MRGFRSWDQFAAMLSCQLSQTRSLRENEEGMRASEGKLRHLGFRIGGRQPLFPI